MRILLQPDCSLALWLTYRSLLTILVCSVDLIACWCNASGIKVGEIRVVFAYHDKKVPSILD